MKLQCKIDQSASIRRGINAPHSITDIEVDVAALTQPQRDYIATHLRDGHKMWSEYSNDNYPKPLKEPTEKGFLEMIEHGIALEAASRAREEASAKKRAEETEARIKEACALIVQDVKKVCVNTTDTDIYRTEEDALNGGSCGRDTYITGAGYTSLPPEIQKLWDAEAQRRAAILAERKAAQDAKTAAIELEIEARIDAMLNDTQRQMRQRGMLNIKEFREKVWKAERIAIRGEVRDKLGDAYDVETGAYFYEGNISGPEISQKQFRHLVHIENTLGLKPGGVHVQQYSKTSITVFYRITTPLGCDVYVKIRYPASME